MTTFLEVPNADLGDFAPCPYARSARVNNQIEILESDAKDLYIDTIDCLPLLDNREIVVIAFDHNMIDPVTLQETVGHLNSRLMPVNYVVLEDHPHSPEYVNGVKMNFGYCGLLMVQKLDKLNVAADRLREQGYYKSWDKFSLDSVVAWRYIQHEIC
jgi:hypothetical protein